MRGRAPFQKRDDTSRYDMVPRRRARETRRGPLLGRLDGQAHDGGRGDPRAPRRHDHRDRRLGLAPQADGARARDPALPAQGSHDRLLRRSRRRAALRRRQGAPGRLRLRVAGFDSARAALPQGARGRPGGGARARRGHAPVGPVRGRAAASLPADARRARLRRDAALPGAEDRDLAVRGSGGAGGDARARARRRARAREPRRCQGQRPVPRPRSLLRRSPLHGCPPALSVLRADRRAGGFREGRLRPDAARLAHVRRRRGRGAGRRAPDRVPARLRPGRGLPARVRREQRRAPRRGRPSRRATSRCRTRRPTRPRCARDERVHAGRGLRRRARRVLSAATARSWPARSACCRRWARGSPS